MLSIESVSYKVNLYDWRTVVFNQGINVLYSRENTKGKTTSLRIVLYAMGFPVPEMHEISFSQMQYVLTLRNYRNELVVIRRFYEETNDMLSICVDGDEKELGVYSVVKNIVQRYIFGIDNELILDNLLGVFYIDQERGWSMLNRGKIIGNISFVIEEFLCGLGDVDITELKNKRDKVNSEIAEYKTLLTFANLDYSSQLDNGDIVIDSVVENKQKERSALKYKLSYLEKELRSLYDVLDDNESFLSMIERYCLYIRTSENDVIQVTRDNIVGGRENMAYLRTRIAILEAERANMEEEYQKIQSNIELQLGDFSDENLLSKYKAKIHGLELNFAQISETIDTLLLQRKSINNHIRELAENSYSHKISKKIIEYLARLQVKHNYSRGSNVVLTNKLAPYAGAEFSKRVLAFRFAYLKAVEKATGLRLPIIIDSPYAKEIDGANFKKMMDILSSDFKGHQIIIASIKDEITAPHFRININRGIFEYPLTYLAIPQQF